MGNRPKRAATSHKMHSTVLCDMPSSLQLVTSDDKNRDQQCQKTVRSGDKEAQVALENDTLDRIIRMSLSTKRQTNQVLYKCISLSTMYNSSQMAPVSH